MTAELLDYAGDGGAKDKLEVASSVGVAVAWSSYHSFRFVPPNALASGNKVEQTGIGSSRSGEPPSGDR